MSCPYLCLSLDDRVCRMTGISAYLVDICMGFQRVQFLWLLFARLLEHTSLKPMHCHSSSVMQALKPMHTATNKKLKAHRMIQNHLKPIICIATTKAHEHATWRHVSHAHTHTQLHYVELHEITLNFQIHVN